MADSPSGHVYVFYRCQYNTKYHFLLKIYVPMYVSMYLCAYVSIIPSNAQMYDLATTTIFIMEQGTDQQD